jgi:hypothetical protein
LTCGRRARSAKKRREVRKDLEMGGEDVREVHTGRRNVAEVERSKVSLERRSKDVEKSR